MKNVNLFKTMNVCWMLLFFFPYVIPAFIAILVMNQSLLIMRIKYYKKPFLPEKEYLSVIISR